MFARINFLLGLGLLIQITFYFAGVYLLVRPLSAFAPALVTPVAGIAILAAVGVTVQLLSTAMSDLRGVALYAEDERAGMLVYLSQAAMLVGHVGAIYFGTGLLVRGEPVTTLQLLMVAATYLVGSALGVVELRRRKLART
ncbi:MAG: hypothetical protein ABI648_14285 [Betaproteobacteria bacterium]|jgi:hypothetical protein